MSGVTPIGPGGRPPRRPRKPVELEGDAAVARLEALYRAQGDETPVDPASDAFDVERERMREELPPAEAAYPPTDRTGSPFAAPARVAVILRCPSCHESTTVEATLSARVVRDSDGTGHLALRTRAAKVAHLCGQQSLGLAEGPRVR